MRGMTMWRASLACVVGAALFASMPVSTARAQDDDPVELEEVLVVARLSGAPTWRVSRGDATLVLVGAIQAVPASLDWRPDALERAAAQADRVLYTQMPNLSPLDMARAVANRRRLTRLPEGTTTADYLSPAWQARLQALSDRYDMDLSTSGFMLTSTDLMFNMTGLFRGRPGSVEETVRRVQRRGRTPAERVARVRGDQVLTYVLAMPPAAWTPCIEQAIVAAEAGESSMSAWADAWRRFDVASVMSAPLQTAITTCWPWGDPEYGRRLRTGWSDGLARALQQSGVTLAVVPLHVLAENGGVLDDLQGQGLTVEGPAWRRGG